MSPRKGRKAMPKGGSGVGGVAKDRQNEKGATLVIVALFATTLALFTSLTANVGLMVNQRTKLQAAADAAALAGAWALDMGDATAIAAAKQYALSNGFTLNDPDVTVENASRVRVKLSSPIDLLLGDLLGRPSATVAAASAAQFQLVSRGLRPLAIPDPQLDAANPQDFAFGTPYLIKKGPQDSISGNFAALDLVGGGARNFEDNFKYGANVAFHLSQQVMTETGNMFGATARAAEFLMAKNPRGTLTEAQQDPTHDPRVIDVVLVDPQEFSNLDGTKPLTIKGFAKFWLDFDSKGKGEVKAYYIGRITNQNEMQGTKYHAKIQLVL